jgi:hypothetical protein
VIRRNTLAARLRELAPWIVLACVWAAFVWARHGGLYAASDDAYIYLGYVKRALTEPRELFSYNPGEHSAGITGMLYYYYLLFVCGFVRAIAASARIETDLLLGLFLANTALLLLAAHLYLRCWRRLTDGGSRSGALSLSLSFLLFCAQPKWLWSVFAGLEGPLAASLVLLVLDRLLARAPAWQASVAASLLVATRPETMLVAWALPGLAVRAESSSLLFRRGVLAYASAGACLSALVLPCYVLTGRVFPSSLGTRVHLAALLEPSGVTRYLQSLLARPEYWLSEWWVLAGAGLLAGLGLGVRTGRWTVARLFGFLLSFLALRVIVGLAAFSLEDRYVSYLWPLYALGIAACASAALRAASARAEQTRFVPSRGVVALAALLVYAGAAAIPVRDFALRTSWHVAAMNAIVVEPSRWMRTRLPADARVCMEPAGAIRVFTDFYLVDAIGLTTTHARTHAGNFPDFLYDHRVGWVFDRPDHVGDLLLGRRAARDVASFGRGMPWGDIHLYEIDLSATITLVQLTMQPMVTGRARALFDNNVVASWNPLVGGGSGFASEQWPGLLTAEFAEPILVDEISVSLSGVRGRSQSRRALASHSFEGKRNGAWTRLPEEPTRSESTEGREIWTFSLPEPTSLAGIRVVREDGSAALIDELTFLHAGRPYVWLWGDTLRARGGS